MKTINTIEKNMLILVKPINFKGVVFDRGEGI